MDVETLLAAISFMRKEPNNAANSATVALNAADRAFDAANSVTSATVEEIKEYLDITT